MKQTDIASAGFGELVPTIGGELAFVPKKLPPHLEWTSNLVSALSEAERAIGKLHGIELNLPNPNLFITPFLRKEAEMSSRIEGTQANIEQLYLFEAGPSAIESKVPDVKEVSNYISALEYGLEKVKQLPVCLRMIRQLHEILMRDVRGQQRAPGQFRAVQNWIGPRGCPIDQAHYVPPPPDKVQTALGDLEMFLNRPPGDLPILVWLAMIHYQFEAIHPFLDGNGRIGRLLIALLLCEKKILDKPLLYLSAYFERNRQDYYERLLRLSTHGEWPEWIFFFLRGIVEQSQDAFERLRQLMDLQQKYHQIVHRGKGSGTLIRLVDLLIERPLITITYASKACETTYMTARNAIARLIKLGILREFGDVKRNRIYIAPRVLEIIDRPFEKR